MEFVLILIVGLVWLVQFAARQNKKQDDGRQPAAKPAPAKSAATQRRAQMERAGQWRAAKAQQDDARQVHSINMDSCENRLESLKTLYDAGILDREEYAERVARVKAKHAHGAGR